jgi:MFS family permease
MPPRPRAAVVTLGIAQCVAWGILYYAFGVLLVPMARELGVSTTAAAATMSIAALTSAAAAVPLGRRFDRVHLPAWMALGALFGAGVLAGWSRARGLGGLYLVGAGLGIAQALTLYEPAFAVVARWFADERARARSLMAVTLFGGLASTVFVPITTLLVERLGWRGALLALAALLALLPAAGTGLLLPHLLGPAERASTVAPLAGPAGAPRERGPTLYGLAVLFFMISLTTTALAVHLPAALSTSGHSAREAAAVVGWTGAMQLAGRLTLPLLSGRTVRLALLLSLAPLALGFVTLAAAPPTPLLLLGLSALGAGAGALTLLRPLSVSRLFEREIFGRVSGVLAVAHHAARAAAPLGAAWIFDRTGSYTLLFVGSVAGLALAAVAVVPCAAAPVVAREHAAAAPTRTS